MKSILIFCGDLSQNNGPANVNKKIRENSNFVFVDTKSKNKVKIIYNFFKNIFFSKVVIFSSNYRFNYILFRISKILRKKTIYLMHGYSRFDTKINKVKNADEIVKRESKIFKYTDLILIVSKLYMEILLKEVPEYGNKMHYLISGIDINQYSKNSYKNNKRSKNSIAVCGGNRLIKKNSTVCQAVKQLNREDFLCNLSVYGEFYPNNENIDENENIKIFGRISQTKLFDEFSKTKLFVLNSQYESFGLSVIDALMCGCNVLITKNAGVTSLLKLDENDIINNTDDLEEISKKIKYNLLHNNNKKIVDSIDFEHYSWKNVSKRFEKIALSLIQDEDYRKIV